MTLLELKDAIAKLDAPDDAEVVIESDGFGYADIFRINYDYTFDFGIQSNKKYIVIS